MCVRSDFRRVSLWNGGVWVVAIFGRSFASITDVDVRMINTVSGVATTQRYCHSNYNC